MLTLIKSSAGNIHSTASWLTVCDLLGTVSIHPRAAPAVLEALASICAPQNRSLNEANFGPCLDIALRFVEQFSKVGGP